MNYSKKHK